MVKLLHSLSATAFYILGGSFFLAYVLFRNDIITPWPLWWLYVGDLPLMTSAILYGGLSLYLSLARPERSSRFLQIIIAIPLVALFIALITLNFWTLLGN